MQGDEMADEPSQAPAQQDTPEAAQDTPQGPQGDELAPDPGSLPEDTNWRERYENLQPKFTQTAQEAARQRQALETLGVTDEWIEAYQDPETREDALEALMEAHGYELGDDEEDDDDFEDEDEDFDEDEEEGDPRIDAVIEHLTEREQEELLNDIADHIEDLAEGQKVELSDKQFDYLLRQAVEAGPSEEGTERAFKEWYDDRKSIEEQALSKYRDSKQAPSPPPQGQGSGTPEVPIDDDRQRRRHMERVASQILDSS